jgi:hypothetical protein
MVVERVEGLKGMDEWETDLVLNISTLMLRSKQIRNLTTLRRNRLRADLRRLAFGNTIENTREFVIRVLADLLRTLRITVIESLHSTKRLHKSEIPRAASRNNLATRKNTKLDSKTARRRTTTINQKRVASLLSTRQRQSQALVETLSNSRDAHAERGRVFVGEVVGEFALHVAFCYGVLGEAAVFFFDGVDAVRETCNAVAGGEVFGYFGADLHDGAHVVAADGAAFALLGEGGDVDVLPGRRWGLVGVPRIPHQCGEYRLPVCRVESDRMDLDEDIVVSHSGQGDFLHLRLAYAGNLDGFHGLR